MGYFQSEFREKDKLRISLNRFAIGLLRMVWVNVVTVV
jgi:hypothetical protein